MTPYNKKKPPIVDVTDRNLTRLTTLAIEKLEAWNNPPQCFLQGLEIVRIATDSLNGNRVVTFPVRKHSMRKIMALSAQYIETRQRGDKQFRMNVSPPIEIVENVLAHPDALPLPVLRGITSAPYLYTAPCGSVELVKNPGYNDATQLFLVLDTEVKVPEISKNPTAGDVAAAVAIFDDLFGEFPFVDAPDRANAIGLALLPFARELIGPQPTPLHVILAPGPGHGKSLLGECALMPGCGPIGVQAFGTVEAEQTKRITTVLKTGAAGVLFDNLTGRIDSAPLAMLLTAKIWNDRALGSHLQLTLNNRATWCATANSANLSNDIQRRCCPISLDAKMQKPTERRIERAEPLCVFARRKRGDLIGAGLTIISAWAAAGMPPATKRLGGFEAWSNVIGGCLAHAGIVGFLENVPKFFESTNEDGGILQTFIGVWADMHGEDSVSIATLMPLADQVGVNLGSGTSHSQRIHLGRLLSQNKERLFERGILLEKRPLSRGVPQWGLKCNNK